MNSTCNAGFNADTDDAYLNVDECDDATFNDCDDNVTCSYVIGIFSCQCDSDLNGPGTSALISTNVLTQF